MRLDELHYNINYQTVLTDHAIINAAYVEEGSAPSFIVLKDTDSFIKKIIFYVVRFFGGYTSINLSLHRELQDRNVVQIFTQESLTQKLEEKTRELENLERTLDEYSGQIRDASNKITNLEKEEDNLNKLIISHHSKILQYQTKSDNVQDEFEQKNKKLESLKKEISEMKLDYLDLVTKKSQYEAEVEKIGKFHPGVFYERKLEEYQDGIESNVTSGSQTGYTGPVMTTFCDGIRTLKADVEKGVTSPEQKTTLLERLKKIPLHEGIKLFENRLRAKILMEQYIKESFQHHLSLAKA